MATKVHMEALSPTMEEGRLVKWTKHEGDPVKSGDHHDSPTGYRSCRSLELWPVCRRASSSVMPYRDSRPRECVARLHGVALVLRPLHEAPFLHRGDRAPCELWWPWARLFEVQHAARGATTFSGDAFAARSRNLL